MFTLFKKKSTLIDTSNKEELLRKEQLLKDAGIWTNWWSTAPFTPIDGPHMKNGDWAGKRPQNKDDQRMVYHLEVLEKDKYEAMKILLEDGGVDLSEG